MLDRGQWLFPCDCGYGPGWYHNESGTRHEYNPNVPEEQATAQKWADRKQLGEFFTHISGTHVRAEIVDISGTSCRTRNAKKFTYRKYLTQEAAKRAASGWVVENVQNGDVFHEAVPLETQMEMFE